MNKSLLALLLITGGTATMASAQSKLLRTETTYNNNVAGTIRYGYIGAIKSITPLKGYNLISESGMDLSHLADSVLDKQSNGEYKLSVLTTYNNQQAPVKKSYYNSNNNISSTVLFSYHNNGLLSKEIKYNADSTNVDEIVYDDAGRLINENYYNVTGVDTFVQQRTILYDNGRIKRDYNKILSMAQANGTWSIDSVEYYYQNANTVADSIYSYRKSVSASSMGAPFVLEGKRYISYSNTSDTLVDSTYFNYGYSTRSVVVNYRYSGDSVILEQQSLDNNNNPILIPTYRIKSVDSASGDITETNVKYVFYVPDNKVRLDYAAGNVFDANGYLKENFGLSEDSLGNLVKSYIGIVYRNSDHNIDSVVYDNIKYVNYYENTTSVKDLPKNVFKIYPNPSNGVFNIASEAVNAFNVIVYDAMGRIVGSFNQAKQIDLTNQPVGNYIFKIYDQKTKEIYIHHAIKK